MSEPAYLCLTPMYRAMYPIESPIYLGDSSILPIKYSLRSIAPSWPPSRQSSIDDYNSDYLDIEMPDQDTTHPWKGSISIDSSRGDDEHNSILFRYILNRFPESNPAALLSALPFGENEMSPPPYVPEELPRSLRDCQYFDAPPDADNDWNQYSLLFFDSQPSNEEASPADSLFNNYESSDESIPPLSPSSRLAWNGSPSNFIAHVGGGFLELTPRSG
ncbi:hypothetical protein LOZ58_002562 [Ophidiomyces ophidiicola]|nr:hypothetical protein LOZ65_001936 [Ophidiomyces ophidiicola]KAI1962938.1 hypothetical protein LOZ58_002562 [Ophidiomyces ophidiicola]